MGTNLVALPHVGQGSLRDFYRVIFRQKRKIILFFCTVMVVTALATFLLPKVYQSEATLMVRLGRESVTLDPTATTGQVLNIGQQARDNEVKTELQILQSRDLAEKVVDALGPDIILAGEYSSNTGTQSGLLTWIFGKTKAASKDEVTWERDKAVRSLMKNLKFDSQKNSNIISVSYETQSPKLAQAVIDKLIQFYLDKHIQVHRTAGSEEFFHQQTEQLRTRLAQTENTLKDLKNQSGIGSVTEQRSILLNRIGSLQRSIEETGAALASSQSKVQAMGKTLAALPKTLVRTKITGYSGNPIDFLQQRLLELQLKEKDLLTTMTDKSRMVQDIKQQIAETQELMGKEGATHEQVNSLALLTERANLAKFRTKAGVLKEELASAQNELKALNDAEVRIAQLEREHEIQKANYRNYSDKLSQARIDRALELEKISNISVVQPASYPVKPIRPRKALNLALGFFLAAFGALGLACSSEYLDHTFQTPEEVTKKLQWPVLAAIPRFIPQGVKGSQGARAPFLLPQSEGWDMAVEMTTQWRLIPANLLGSRSSQETARLLALISCYPGEGVSTVATSLALNLAQQQGGRVLLVDTNVVARPAAHQFLGVDHNTGLAEISTLGPDKTNGILPSSINNLDILPLGHSQANLARFFESRQFTELLNIWKQEYNFVLVDTPALHEAGWVTQLASMANGVVLVIEAEQTRWEVVQQAKVVLEKAHANVLGVVLNKRKFHIPEWLYKTL